MMKRFFSFIFISLKCIVITAAVNEFWYGDFKCYITDDGKVNIQGINNNCQPDIVFPVEVTDSLGKVYQVYTLAPNIIPDHVTSIQIPYSIPIVRIFPIFSDNYESTEIQISFYGDKTKAHYYISDGFMFTSEKKDTLLAPLYARRHYDIPEGVHCINGFAWLDHMESVTLPSTAIELLDWAFRYCSSLSNVVLPPSLKAIGYGAFSYCTNLKCINLSNVEDIGVDAFAHSGLEEVTIPNQIKVLKMGSFSGCYSLQRISLPDTMQCIGGSCFQSVRAQEIKLPLYVDSICACAFSYYQGKKLILPQSLKYISTSSFYKFDTIYCNNPVPPEVIKDSRQMETMFGCSNLYVPELSYQAYKDHPYWGQIYHIWKYDFLNDIAIPDDPITIVFSCPDDNHPHIVDLGIGVKWACCNVGATRPEEFGGYYKWGETEESYHYDWSNYEWAYWSNAEDYWVCQYIGKHIGGTKYDVAHEKWGDGWRMPNEEEMSSLINNCLHQNDSVNGVQGMFFVGADGISIFMPKNKTKTWLTVPPYWGKYWSDTSTSNNLYKAQAFTFGDDSSLGNSPQLIMYDRCEGLSVRPVWDETLDISNTNTDSDGRNSKVYNLAGIIIADNLKESSHLKPGIYIVGGKKIVIK